MPLMNSLTDFIALLEKRRELKRIPIEADPVLEITEIARRVMSQEGPALLFERPKGSTIPLLIGAFGTWQRMCLALGAERIEEIVGRIEEILKLEPPSTLWEKIKVLPKLKEFSDIVPLLKKTGPCQEVVVENGPFLSSLPILKCWPGDGGRYITLPIVITKDPETDIRNVGMYRMQVYDDKTTGMHWHPQKHGAQHLRAHAKLGRKMEVAVALGGDPVTIYSATAPVPEGLDELLFAGLLRRAPVEIVKCRTIDLEVPANAEIVLEGYVDPQEKRLEGPFGDHTGYYSQEGEFPVFHVTCMTRRNDAVYPATIVGKPPMEDCFMGKASERLFLPFIKKILPEVRDLSLPIEGIFHNFAFVSIDKRYPGHAHRVAHALWGLGQIMFTKVIVIFDAGVNVQDMKEVVWRLGNSIDPKRDVFFVEGPVDILNFASPVLGFGSKMGIDATRKLREEGHGREWPKEIEMSPEITALVNRRWKDYGL